MPSTHEVEKKVSQFKMYQMRHKEGANQCLTYPPPNTHTSAKNKTAKPLAQFTSARGSPNQRRLKRSPMLPGPEEAV